MKRKYEVIGIVIDTEKEAQKCSFLSMSLTLAKSRNRKHL